MSAKLFRGLDRTLDALEYAALAVAGLLILALICVITLSVFSRYFLGNAMAWNVEVSEYILLIATFLPASYLMKTGGHVALDIVVDNLPARLARAARLFTLAVSLAAFLLFGYFAFAVMHDYLLRGTVTYNVLQLPRWLLMSPIVIGSALMVLRLARMLAAEIAAQYCAGPSDGQNDTRRPA